MTYKDITMILMSLLMTACSSGGDAVTTLPTDTSQVQTTVTAAPSETKVSITTPAVPTEPVDLEKGLTDEMYSRALISEGNRSRLAAVMNRAEKGEPITVATIGGSITQGSLASSPNNCYASLFYQYWQEKFPSSEVTFVNAGIGGTDSYLGVHRADTQLLCYEPDVVVVEFSVNDTDKLMNKYSYDSLVRKILTSDSAPAVILLFTTQDNGASLWETHCEIGKAYDLPMLSYREAVYPEVAAGTLDWKAISPDNIHPNDAGHSLIGQIMSRYLDGVYNDRGSIDTSDLSFSADPYTSDYYKDGHIVGAEGIEAEEISGFEIGGNYVYPELFPDNFVTEGEGYLKFECDCRCRGLFYLKQTDGNGGKYEVYIDGARKGTVDADFSGGWGNYGATQQILISKETAHHTVEIKLAEGSSKTALTILGIMLS
ncbi:MAG: SGNH/GDSL hydrolase family protein [Oscillospiraceae bacterium]|nr:SGNH/GDSL hydrolase family protein [Oscillospiraceae bacterium]